MDKKACDYIMKYTPTVITQVWSLVDLIHFSTVPAYSKYKLSLKTHKRQINISIRCRTNLFILRNAEQVDEIDLNLLLQKTFHCHGTNVSP